MSYQSADNLAALCSYLLLSVHNMGGVTDREESVTMGPAATRTLCEEIWFCFCSARINKDDGAVCYSGSGEMSTANGSARRT